MRPELKIQHILTLTHLIKIGAGSKFIQVTTATLGQSINKSQQAASGHLLDLENNGFIERSGRSVRVTKRGIAEVKMISSALSVGLDKVKDVEFRGTLESGMGEGAYYMSSKGYTTQFKSKLGYVPFPGTLNVRLDSEYIHIVEDLGSRNDGYMIDGFSDSKRTYGWVMCYPVTIKKTKCHLIRLERTHHDVSVVEIISKECIREAYRLKDGSKITLSIKS